MFHVLDIIIFFSAILGLFWPFNLLKGQTNPKSAFYPDHL